MHVSTLAAFATALAIVVAIPGPGILAVVSCAMARGLKDALGLVGGMLLGDLTYFALAVFGMASLARSMGEVFIAVKILGAAYLIWLGLNLWRQRAARHAAPAAGPSPARGVGRSVLGGLAVTLGNPKAIAFYAGLLPTFIDLGRLAWADAVGMAVIVVIVVAGIGATYAVAAAGGRRFFVEPRRLTWMNRAAGTMMIGAGVSVAVK